MKPSADIYYKIVYNPKSIPFNFFFYDLKLETI